MRSPKILQLIEQGVDFSTPIATQLARLTSNARMDAPPDEEMEAIFDEVATAFGGTFNNFTNEAGETRYDWQFHLPKGITIQQVREVMRSLGFNEFWNLNLRSHRATLPFDLGGFHWKGNIRGNWYHIEFRRSAWRANEVRAVDAHYDVDRPTFIFHRTATGKQKRSTSTASQ
jgi:hypothetical protein